MSGPRLVTAVLRVDLEPPMIFRLKDVHFSADVPASMRSVIPDYAMASTIRLEETREYVFTLRGQRSQTFVDLNNPLRVRVAIALWHTLQPGLQVPDWNDPFNQRAVGFLTAADAIIEEIVL
jgi:hypothetical protein